MDWGRLQDGEPLSPFTHSSPALLSRRSWGIISFVTQAPFRAKTFPLLLAAPLDESLLPFLPSGVNDLTYCLSDHDSAFSDLG